MRKYDKVSYRIIFIDEKFRWRLTNRDILMTLQDMILANM